MKISLKVALLFLLAISFVQVLQGQDLWYSVDKSEYGFSVFFPQRATEAESKLDTEIGELQQITYYLNREKGPVYFFQVNYIEYPDQTVHSDSTELLELFYEETLNAATEEMKGVLAYSSDVYQQGFQGKLYRIDYLNDQFTLKAKTFMVRNRYYSVQVIFKKGKEVRAVDRFLDSFRIIPVQETK